MFQNPGPRSAFRPNVPGREGTPLTGLSEALAKAAGSGTAKTGSVIENCGSHQHSLPSPQNIPAERKKGETTLGGIDTGKLPAGK